MSRVAQSGLSCASSSLARPCAPPRWHRVSQGGWIAVDQAIISLSSFLATVIVGRVCGAEALGVFVLAVTTFWLLAGIPNSLVWTPYTSRAPRLSPVRRARYAGSVTAHMALVTAAIAAALLVVALVSVVISSEAAWFSTTCILLIPFSVMMLLREHVRRIYWAHLQVYDLLMIDAPIAIVQITLLLALAWFKLLSVATALLAIGIACAVAISWFVREHRRLEFRSGRVWLHWQYNLRFGRWLLAVSLAWLVGDSAYRWIIGWLHGLDAVGQLAAAQATVMCINPLLLTVQTYGRAVASNQFAVDGIGGLRRVTVNCTLIVAATAGIAFICLAMVGGPLVAWIFGSAYGELGTVVATLSIGMFARFLSVPIDAAMVTLRQGRVMFYAAVAQLIVILGAGVPLMDWLGLNGVGYTMALGFGAATLVQWSAFLHASSSELPTGSVTVPTV